MRDRRQALRACLVGLYPPQTLCPQPAPGTVVVVVVKPTSPAGAPEIGSAECQLSPCPNRWPVILGKSSGKERLTFAFLCCPSSDTLQL